jgi:phosphate:Na+ symporter
LVGLATLLPAYAVVAVTSETTETVEMGLKWTTIGMGLFGGLAMFPGDMVQMSDAIKVVTGASMTDLLARRSRVLCLSQ